MVVACFSFAYCMGHYAYSKLEPQCRVRLSPYISSDLMLSFPATKQVETVYRTLLFRAASSMAATKQPTHTHVWGYLIRRCSPLTECRGAFGGF